MIWWGTCWWVILAFWFWFVVWLGVGEFGFRFVRLAMSCLGLWLVWFDVGVLCSGDFVCYFVWLACGLRFVGFGCGFGGSVWFCSVFVGLSWWVCLISLLGGCCDCFGWFVVVVRFGLM